MFYGFILNYFNTSPLYYAVGASGKVVIQNLCGCKGTAFF